ncbi:MAG: hypothetical protein LBT44_02925 [Clostridiales bacterium]|jgi:hypothetical protein|nr:hypothetical protein [Clostridiales bacterium]
MGLTLFELRKILSRKLFPGLLIFGIGLNLFSLWQEHKTVDLAASAAETKAFFAELRTVPSNNKAAWLDEQSEVVSAILLRETIVAAIEDGMPAERLEAMQRQYAESCEKHPEILNQTWDIYEVNHRKSLIDQTRAEITVVLAYPEYLDEIEQNAKRAESTGIFGAADDFSSKNIKKSADIYRSMAGTEPRYDINDGVMLVVKSPVTDILLIVLTIFLCMVLISDEKEKSLFKIICAAQKGKASTISAKFGALLAAVLGTHTLLFVSTLAFAEYRYGFGDLSRPLQSVPDAIGSTLHISVGQFIPLLFLVKTLGIFLFGLLFMFIAMRSNSAISFFVSSVMNVGICAALLYLPNGYAWDWLKQLNLLAIVQPYGSLRDYSALNLFGVPVGTVTAQIVFAAAILVLLIVLNIRTFVCGLYLFNKGNALLQKMKNVHIKKTNPIHGSLFFFEWKKLLFENKAVLIVVLFFALQYALLSTTILTIPADEGYYQYYMEMLEGGLTDEKGDFILSERMRIDEAKAVTNTLQQQYQQGEIGISELALGTQAQEKYLNREAMFERLYQKYLHIKATPGAEFFYDSGYERLFRITDSDYGIQSVIILLAALTLSFCGLFSVEYRTEMFKVLGASHNGTIATVHTKLRISAVLTGVFATVSMIPDVFLIYRMYGFSHANLALNNMPTLGYLGGLPIWGYLIVLLLTRFLVCFAVMLIISAVSLLSKNNIYTAMLTMVLFILPFLLHLLGVTVLDKWSLLQLLVTTGIFTGHQSVWEFSIQIVALLLCCGLSMQLLFRKFAKAQVLR